MRTTSGVQVPVLRRGAHVLPNQSQIMRRDLCAEELARCGRFGKRALGFTLNDDDIRERGGPGYRYLVRAPGASALAWTAFRERVELDAFAAAYGMRVEGELVPDERFEVVLPDDASGFLPLTAGPDTVEVVGPVYDDTLDAEGVTRDYVWLT